MSDVREQNERKTHHQELITLFMTKLLTTPNLFEKYKKTNIYPVVLGGVDVIRCCHGRGSTQDIDIKFVVTSSVSGPDDPTFQEAIKLRDQFLVELMELANESGMLGPTTMLHISDPDASIKSVRVSIYEENNGKKEVLIDTGIFSDYSMNMFAHFANFFKMTKPIPTYIENHIPFATCSWTLVDTVRMMHVCSAEPGPFWRKKYIKYVAKFALLYKSYNNKSVSNDDHMERAFTLANQYIASASKESNDANKESLVSLLNQYTNIEAIEAVLVQNPQIDVTCKSIIYHILNTTLPKYMKKYATDAHYPVILGGADVYRCVESLFKIDVKDIDIQFVVKDDTPANIAAAQESKEALVSDIVNDQELAAYIHTLNSNGLVITLSQFSDWDKATAADNKNHDKQKEMKLVVLSLDFSEADTGHLIKQVNIMDLIVLGKSIQDYLPHIPFIRRNGVLYATCKFTFANTLRMMNFYKDEHEKDPTNKKVLQKYLRYICKYVAMYMSMSIKKISRAKMQKMKKLYRKVSHILRGTVLRNGESEKTLAGIISRLALVSKSSSKSTSKAK